LGKNAEAVESLNRFISTAPQKVIYDDYKYLGRAYSKVGTPEADSLSIVNLEKAAPLDTTENLYREIAQKYYETKRYDKAANYYSQTIQKDKKPLNNDYLFKALANYQYAFRVGRDSTAAPMDTAQIRQAKQLYFLRADSSFAQMAQGSEAIGQPYPLAYYYRGQSTYYAYPSAVSLSTGAAVPYYEKFIELANAEPDSTKKQAYQKNLITSYKFLASYNLAKKDEAKAKEYFNKVLELDPNDADVQRALNPVKTTPKPAAKPGTKAPAKKPAATK
jgi:tetratricopeptide (TPR) repeat protein